MMIRELELLCCEDKLGIGIVHPGEEKAPETFSGLPVLTGTCKEHGDRLFSRPVATGPEVMGLKQKRGDSS